MTRPIWSGSPIWCTDVVPTIQSLRNFFSHLKFPSTANATTIPQVPYTFANRHYFHQFTFTPSEISIILCTISFLQLEFRNPNWLPSFEIYKISNPQLTQWGLKIVVCLNSNTYFRFSSSTLISFLFTDDGWLTILVHLGIPTLNYRDVLNSLSNMLLIIVEMPLGVCSNCLWKCLCEF